MARKNNGSKFKGMPTITFMRYELSSEDKKKFAEFQKKPPMSFDDMIVDLTQNGHKLTISFNETSDSFIVSVTGSRDECVNQGKCYTSHAKDYILAMWVALFKNFVVWKNGVWEDVEDGEDFG